MGENVMFAKACFEQTKTLHLNGCYFQKGIQEKQMYFEISGKAVMLAAVWPLYLTLYILRAVT